jgi:hypothetical protein
MKVGCEEISIAHWLICNLMRMFFTSGAANDTEYITLRDDPRFLKEKARIEQLWKVHEPYADIHFCKRLQSNCTRDYGK